MEPSVGESETSSGRNAIVRDIGIITVALCVASLVLRLLGRGYIVRRIGADDIFITLATVSISAICI